MSHYTVRHSYISILFTPVALSLHNKQHTKYVFLQNNVRSHKKEQSTEGVAETYGGSHEEMEEDSGGLATVNNGRASGDFHWGTLETIRLEKLSPLRPDMLNVCSQSQVNRYFSQGIFVVGHLE
jgi:hypothetical protein